MFFEGRAGKALLSSFLPPPLKTNPRKPTIAQLESEDIWPVVTPQSTVL